MPDAKQTTDREPSTAALVIVSLASLATVLVLLVHSLLV